VVKVMLPVVAPAGTVVVTVPSFTNVNGAAVPWNRTNVTPVKFDPSSVTDVPTGPLLGEKLVIFGPVTVNVPEDVPVPDGFVTEILPDVAPFGTVAVILPLFTTVKESAAVALNLTAVVPKKFEPKIDTTVPTLPLPGLNPVITGALVPVTVKLPRLWSFPLGLNTDTFPVVAPAGTVAWICELLLMTNCAAAPLNRTEFTAENVLPVIVTDVPTGPLLGLKSVMFGPPPPPAVTVKVVVPAVPLGVCTEIGPVAAPPGTLVVICVPGPFTLNTAAVPLNATENAPPKPAPLIVTVVPTGPVCGLKLVICGGVPA
jgi:hypothetical protein